MTLQLILPEGSTLLAKKGQITIGEKLYSIGHEETTSIQVSEKLKIKPEQIFQHLKIVIGDKVDKGTLLGERKNLLGKSAIFSDYQGTVTHISHETGTINVATHSENRKTVKSFFKGKIEDYDQASGKLSVSIDKAKVIELKEVRDNSGGKIVPISSDTDYFSLSEEMLTGSIVAIDEPQPHFEPKLEALSINGYMFLKGTSSSLLPYAKIKNIDDFKLLLSGKYSHVVFSSFEKKALVYLI